MRFCCRSAKATAFWPRSPRGKIDELIAHTYKGDHEKMKQAVNNVAAVLQGLQKELARLTDASKEGKLTERGNQDQFQGAYADIVRGVNAILDAILLYPSAKAPDPDPNLEWKDRRVDQRNLQRRSRKR